ncbi:XTP/dITP diphosphatase [Oceanobacillus alkalisoli]|uniref:XTP/dITP diphosphatase n=1 Tax=Oceanobacillus alkalisoli TaxID=2925113 RepID=UPI001F119DD2|nr:XTP/dITP diphosphatase [Oceanobacillus alkalisoli]MCF3941913.1 XTP/dITP diphosphatase [Oceanobacillus alkalisoli]
MKEIIIATRNQGKVKEFIDFFQPYGVNVQSLLDIAEQQLPDIEETGNSFAENAALKAEQIAEMLNRPVLADDSGLVVDALDGAPGIYSARYAGEDKSDEANNQKLLQKLQDVPQAERTARFVCVLAIAIPGEKTKFYEGTCEGEISVAPHGKNGFGYDPLFIPNGYQQTMAELSASEKNQISHRSNAIKQLENWDKLVEHK